MRAKKYLLPTYYLYLTIANKICEFNWIQKYLIFTFGKSNEIESTGLIQASMRRFVDNTRLIPNEQNCFSYFPNVKPENEENR